MSVELGNPATICLTDEERKRLDGYMQISQDALCDLGQRPEKRKLMCNAKAPMFTMIHGCGIIWAMPLNRIMSTAEMFTSMGIPITAEDVTAAGLPCIISRQSQGSDLRSRHSLSAAIGNAMNVNSIGAVIAAITVMMPEALVARSSATSSTPSQEFTRLLTNARRLRTREEALHESPCRKRPNIVLD